MLISIFLLFFYYLCFRCPECHAYSTYKTVKKVSTSKSPTGVVFMCSRTKQPFSHCDDSGFCLIF